MLGLGNLDSPARRSTFPTVEAGPTDDRADHVWSRLVRRRTATISASTSAAGPTWLPPWRRGPLPQRLPATLGEAGEQPVHRRPVHVGGGRGLLRRHSLLTTFATISQRDSHESRFRRGRWLPSISIPGLLETLRCT
jgi:hypothetical protein